MGNVASLLPEVHDRVRSVALRSYPPVFACATQATWLTPGQTELPHFFLLPECVTPVAMNARLRDVLAPYAGYISKSKDRSKEKTERSFDILLV